MTRLKTQASPDNTILKEKFMRPSNRNPNELRNIKFTQDFTKHAEGSVLVEFGETKVICTASVTQGVPRFLKDTGQGWVTAEYGMLPRATHERVMRESARGKQGGRTVEIQRLIGRSLRTMVDLKKLQDYTITIDCDVIQADGGTRTASISGACIALVDAIRHLQQRKKISTDPLKQLVASVSVGIYKGTPVLDLDYKEDSSADTDMNLVMTEQGQFVEIQGTAEKEPFNEEEFQALMQLGKDGIHQIIELQKQALGIVA